MKTRAIPFALATSLLLAAMPGAVSAAAPEKTCESRGQAVAEVIDVGRIEYYAAQAPAETGIKVVGHWSGLWSYHCVQKTIRGELESWNVGKGNNNGL